MEKRLCERLKRYETERDCVFKQLKQLNEDIKLSPTYQIENRIWAEKLKLYDRYDLLVKIISELKYIETGNQIYKGETK